MHVILQIKDRLALGFAAAAACFFMAFALLSGCSAGQSGQSGIHLVVEKRLAEALEPSIARLAADLEAEGYVVTIDRDLEASVPHELLRERLRARWKEPGRLQGAILIGEFGAPLFNRPAQQGDPYWHDHLSDLYYMDLDGIWVDTDRNGVYDLHTSFSGGIVQKLASRLVQRVPLGLDRRKAEIWVSRIRAGTLDVLGEEIALYQNYFDRNHAYRTGKQLSVPARAFVVAGGMRVTESGWGARPGMLYDEVSISECTTDASIQLRDRLGNPEGWALGVFGSFSGPQVHKFHVLEGGGFNDDWFRSREGRALIAEYSMLEHEPWDVSSAEIARLAPNVLFYQLMSSEVGRHDVTGYLGGAYIFFGSGLAAIAGTQHSGAMGVPVLYEHLATGMELGEAWRSAIDWSLDHPGKTLTLKWCDADQPWDPSDDPYKAVLLGDGSLRLPASPARKQ